ARRDLRRGERDRGDARTVRCLAERRLAALVAGWRRRGGGARRAGDTVPGIPGAARRGSAGIAGAGCRPDREGRRGGDRGDGRGPHDRAARRRRIERAARTVRLRNRAGGLSIDAPELPGPAAVHALVRGATVRASERGPVPTGAAAAAGEPRLRRG